MKTHTVQIFGTGLTGVLAGLAVLAAAAILLAPGAGRAEKAAPVVDAIRIDITGGPEKSEKMTRFARSLIRLRQGEAFSAAAFSRSVEALKHSKIFETIDVPDPDWSKERIKLVFRLKPFARIKKISINGAFPFLEKEIRNAMSIELGDPCVPENFPEQEKSIESLLSKQGYINPQVSLSAEKDPEDGHFILDVEIDKGRFYRMESLNIRGNRAFSDTRLKIRLKTWQASLLLGGASRFVTDDLGRDIKTLRQFYRKKGYAEVELDSETEKNPDTGEVRITIAISEGPRYRVRFSGNSAFWDYTLKKDLVLFTEGNKNNFGVRKSIRNMEKRYRLAGYSDVRIKAEEKLQDTRGKERVKNIEFIIREGPRYLVESVSISGNSA